MNRRQAQGFLWAALAPVMINTMFTKVSIAEDFWLSLIQQVCLVLWAYWTYHIFAPKRNPECEGEHTKEGEA